MAFDTIYPNRKDHRVAYRDVKKYLRSCRNHQSCTYCSEGRQHFDTKRRRAASQDLQDFTPGED